MLAVLREPFWLQRPLLVVVPLDRSACSSAGGSGAGTRARSRSRPGRPRNYDAAPSPLAACSPTPRTAPHQLEWRPVRLHGTYLADRTVLVRNRPLDGVFGYEVVVPFRPDSGPVLLVDRGWVVNGASGARPDTVPRHRPGRSRDRPAAATEPPPTASPPPARTSGSTSPASPPPLGGRPSRAPTGSSRRSSPLPPRRRGCSRVPTSDLGPHLAYAVQWWLGMVASTSCSSSTPPRRRSAGARGPGADVPSPADAVEDGSGTPARPRGRPPVPDFRGYEGAVAAPRRWSQAAGELTDEEWEDLADAAPRRASRRRRTRWPRH